LLQLNKLELQEAIAQEILENPLLEDATLEMREEIPATEAGKGTESLPSYTEEPVQAEGDPAANEGETDPLSEGDWRDFMEDNSDLHRLPREQREMVPYENVVRTSTTLYEHLLWQLALTRTLPGERKVAEEIIGNLDEDGYLTTGLEEIAAKTGTDLEFVDDVLSLVQEFDPVGVAARSVQECLLLQIRQSDLAGSLVEQIVRDHLHRIERNAIPEIAKALKVPVPDVQEAIEQLRKYEPKPGRQYLTGNSQYIVPDVFIVKVDDEYVIILNDEGIPRLRISSLYKNLLHSSSSTPVETRRYVEKKFKSALWLIKSVQQRQRTIYKVVESVLKFQREFFDKGMSYLRPLVLREVAEDIGMHESTVSRVSTNKYVHTPRGILEIKFFFHGGLQTVDGDEISSLRVKEILRSLIAAEDPHHPLSDAKILLCLKKRGIQVARRTVAKYREELKILPSARRKVY
jgi:RNA polymerase sigma-54 factor